MENNINLDLMVWILLGFAVLFVGVFVRKGFQWVRNDLKILYGERVSRIATWMGSIFMLCVGLFGFFNSMLISTIHSPCEEPITDLASGVMIVDIDCTGSRYYDVKEHNSPEQMKEEIVSEDEFTLSNRITTSHVTRLHVQRPISLLLGEDMSEPFIHSIITDVVLRQDRFYNTGPERQKADMLREEYEEMFLHDEKETVASKKLGDQIEIQGKRAYQEMLEIGFLGELKIEYIDDGGAVLYTAIRAPDRGTRGSLDTSHIVNSFHSTFFHRDFVEFDVSKHYKLRIIKHM